MTTYNHTNWGSEFTEFELSRRAAAIEDENHEWYDQYLDFLDGWRDAFLDELDDTRE